MPDITNIELSADHSIPIEPLGGAVTVKVTSNGPVYYSDSQQVSSANNQGSISNGASQTFTSQVWIIGAAGAASGVQLTVFRGSTSGGNPTDVVLGSDGLIGGPGGTGLTASVAIVSSANTFTAQQTFDNTLVTIQPAGQKAARVQITPTSTTNAVNVLHPWDWSAWDSNPHDLVDIFHRSTGDAIFIWHGGAQIPTFTFTATTASSTTLSVVSSFTGLLPGTPITGAGIPANTYITAINTGASTVTLNNAATASAAGVTMTVTRPSGTLGDVAGVNIIIPYYLDDAPLPDPQGGGSFTTGRNGSVLNNRNHHRGIKIQQQVTTSDGYAANILNWGAAAGLFIDNQNSTGGTPQGTGRALEIQEWGSQSSFKIAANTAPNGGTGQSLLDFRCAWASSGAGSFAPVFQVVDSGSVIRFQLNSRGDVSIQNASSQGCVQLQANASNGADGYVFLGRAATAKIGVYGTAPIVQPSAVGAATGYAAGSTAVTFHSDDTYTGNVGSTAYTVNGIVAALKNLGWIAS